MDLRRDDRALPPDGHVRGPPENAHLMRNLQNGFRPRVAPLDARRLMAAHPTAVLTHGILTIKGTATADVIAVDVPDQANGTVTIAGTRQAFPAAKVRRIELFGGPGNDTLSIQAHGRTDLAVQIVGGGGRDTIDGVPDATPIAPAATAPVVASPPATTPTTAPSPVAAPVVVAPAPVATLRAPAAVAITAPSPTAVATPTARVVLAEPPSPVVATTTTTSSTPTTTAASTPAAVAQEIVAQVNAQRAQAGLAPLTVGASLTQMAAIQAGNMARLGVMSHDLPGTATPGLADRASFVGYNYATLGENIAFNYPDANSVMAGWLASPGHRANILNPNYTEIGVSVAYDATGQPYYAQEFGRPA